VRRDGFDDVDEQLAASKAVEDFLRYIGGRGRSIS
jgi:hypothetical protein